MKNLFHSYTIRADEQPGKAHTFPDSKSARWMCSVLASQCFRPRATFQKSPDHSSVSIPVLIGKRGGVSFGSFNR